MSKSIDIDSLVNKSLSVSLARRYTHNIRPETIGRKDNNERYGVNITPTLQQERQDIENVFNHITTGSRITR